MKRSLAATFAACGIVVSLPAAAAPTAQEIVNRSRAAMKGLKTYQATVLTTMSGGPMSMNMNIKLKTAGSRSWAQLGMTMAGGAAAQQNPFASMLQNMTVVDDGKSTWTYMPAMKQYRKGPSGGTKQFNVGEQFLSRIDTDAALSLAGTENVGGKPAFVVEAKPKKAQPGQNGGVRLYFDQSSYRLVQAKVKQTRPAMGQNPAQEQSVLVVVKDEKVNVPIPDSTFRFTPPAGATEAQGGMGMMGMPGGPRPRK